MNKSKAIILCFGYSFILPELIFSKGPSRDIQRRGSLILRSCKKKSMATDQEIILSHMFSDHMKSSFKLLLSPSILSKAEADSVVYKLGGGRES